MSNLKRICVSLLIFAMLFILAACAENEITAEDLIGVWQAEANPDIFGPPHVAIYITEDGNLYFLFSGMTPFNTYLTSVYHYRYEISGGQLLLIVPEDGVRVSSRNIENARISVRGNVILLDLQEVEDWHIWFHEALYRFYKVADEVPYGWTYEDNREIRALHTRINEGLLTVAQQFGEAIGVRVLPTDDSGCSDFSPHHDNVFYIGDIPAMIAFIGDTPTPRHHQRHARLPWGRFIPELVPPLLEAVAVSSTSASIASAYISTVPATQSPTVMQLVQPTFPLTQVKNASGQFVLRVCEWCSEIPEEWLVAFESLNYSINW